MHTSSRASRAAIHRTLALFTVLLALLSLPLVHAQDELPPAPVENDEGGAVVIRGEMAYSNPLLVMGVSQPLIILEDQAGFVDRNYGFIMPPESQVLGQFTSDFFTSPVRYTLSLPIEPQGTLRDVDNDGESDTGVQIYAVAFWHNVFGDPFLEERDLYGGGWSTAYASTRISESADKLNEIIGGKLLVYASDAEQGFPSGFGADGKLFTEDDPTVRLPQGYTVVDLDTDPFTFSREREADIDTIEPEGLVLDDFSGMSYTDAFDAMVDKLKREYAFTEYKGIDWEALRAEFRPRFEAADAASDPLEYHRALWQFSLRIPDGHVRVPEVEEDFAAATDGGLGIAARELDDGRVIVFFIGEDSPADEAGIEAGAELLSLNGMSITEAIEAENDMPRPFSTEHSRRLQQLRYALRFGVGQEVEVTYQNPGEAEPATVTLTTVNEMQSFRASSLNAGRTGVELPLEYEILDSGLGYAKIYSFSDNDLLLATLWERMIRLFNENGVPGVIIDMRQNGGGSGFMADQLAAYFFNEPLVVGKNEQYNRSIDAFYSDSNRDDRMHLPPEDLRYNGAVAVLVGPACASACEFFAYNMTLQERSAVVGHFPTAGLGGSVQDFAMPEGIMVRFTEGRSLDAEGNIHVEGIGVVPTVDVPVTEESVLGEGDVILAAAEVHLLETLQGTEEPQ
jgi:C-terminal processing protease CtpA/Prc